MSRCSINNNDTPFVKTFKRLYTKYMFVFVFKTVLIQIQFGNARGTCTENHMFTMTKCIISLLGHDCKSMSEYLVSKKNLILEERHTCK